MNTRILNLAKLNRPLSRRGELTGKPGNLVFTAAMAAGIGKMVGAGAGAIVGNQQQEEQNRLQEDMIMERGQNTLTAQQNEQDAYSQFQLSQNNPQGDGQMYARKGASLYYNNGGEGRDKSKDIQDTQVTAGGNYAPGETGELSQYYQDALTKQYGEGNLQQYVAEAAKVTGVDPEEFAAAMIQEGWHPDRFNATGKFEFDEDGNKLVPQDEEGGLSSYYAIGLDTVGEHAREIAIKRGMKVSDLGITGGGNKTNERGDSVTPQVTSDYQEMITNAAALYKYRSEISDATAEKLGIELSDEQRRYFNYMAYNTQHNSPYVTQADGSKMKGNESLEMMMKDFKDKGNLKKTGEDWDKAIRVMDKAEGKDDVAYNPYKKGSGKAQLYQNAGDAYRRIKEVKGSFREKTEDEIQEEEYQKNFVGPLSTGKENLAPPDPGANVFDIMDTAPDPANRDKSARHSQGQPAGSEGEFRNGGGIVPPIDYSDLNGRGYKGGGLYKPYPYQDQSRTMINPTLMYNKGGKTLLSMVQAGKPSSYWTTKSPNNLNNPGNVSKHRDNMDQNYYGSSQDQYPSYEKGGTILERVQGGNPLAYWPVRSPNNLNNPGNVGRHRDNMDMRYPGSSQNFINGGPHYPEDGVELDQAFVNNPPNLGASPYNAPGIIQPRIMSNPRIDTSNPPVNSNRADAEELFRRQQQLQGMPASTPQSRFQGGGSMFDELQNVGMQQYQQYQGGGSYENGGGAQVPGGEIHQLTDKGQEVKGDNPELIDDVELGTNPGEPDAVVDDKEIMVDAVDESGQPYKQIFSDTVLVPGEKKSMAKKAKSYLKQMPEDESSEQAQLLYKKLDELFEVQQMLNGDSQGETAEEASAGGMDPNAAAQMQGQGAFQGGGEYVGASDTMTPNGLSPQETSLWQGLQQNPGMGYQGGGAGYPSAGYDSALREQQMQVPYPRKNYQKGGGMFSGIGNWFGKGKGTKGGSNFNKIASGIGGAAQGFVPGAVAGQSFTKDVYGNNNIAMGVGSLAGLSSSIGTDMADSVIASNQDFKDANQKQWEQDQAQNPVASVGLNDAQSIGYSEQDLQKDYASQVQNMSNLYGNQYGGRGYEDGGVMVISGGEPTMHDIYQDAKAFVDHHEQVMGLPNTLADLQSYSKPENWGTLDQNVDSMRRNSNLMGRVHRGPKLDGSAMVSMSERKGPLPKKKTMKMGGRLYYNSALNIKSLTLSIL